ncbi:MAG: outer membrane beta-barrel protein [Paludibacteraceae bacterium]|nr:outer membrane beta-barrel protein [Paludibacteraceae bacterium]
MKRLFLTACATALTMSMGAQTNIELQQKLDNVKAQLADFDTEHTLDSLDQEQLPRLVSGGVFGGANMSNFIITRDHHTMASHMRVGGELGGFLDFTLTKHFIIEPQVIFTAHQNFFREADGTRNDLWSFGAEIPIYFLGRFGNLEKGYIQFGGGIFTHFTFASNIENKFTNKDEVTPVATETPVINPSDYNRLYSLHDNHFGVCAQVGYECSFGMIINAQYKVSLSDIAGFYSEKKGTPEADALLYPQSISLCIGYRWR